MRLNKVKEWRIHIGTHKTATTHLQDSLASQRNSLAKAGVDYIPMQEVRALKLPPLTGRRNWRMRFWGIPMHRKIEQAVNPLRIGPSRVVMSDEDFLGLSTDLLTPLFYSNAERRLWPFSALSNGSNLKLFLSIRSFDAIIPSAYAQVLRTRNIPGGFDAVKKQLNNATPSWLDLVRRINKTLPKAKLHIWTFESYINDPEYFMSRFCGTDISLPENPPAPSRTKTPSARAISDIEALPKDLSTSKHEAMVEHILHADVSKEKFKPFSTEEQRRLVDLYQQDLEHIEHEFPGVILNTDRSCA